jgi:hypothetical protein
MNFITYFSPLSVWYFRPITSNQPDEECVTMANFDNKFYDKVDNVYQGETLNLTPAKAATLQDIVANKPAEKSGFTDEMKKEVLNALKSIAVDEAKALPGQIYTLLKQFFPGYVEKLLP